MQARRLRLGWSAVYARPTQAQLHGLEYTRHSLAPNKRCRDSRTNVKTAFRSRRGETQHRQPHPRRPVLTFGERATKIRPDYVVT
jgi:hypothetical protein